MHAERGGARERLTDEGFERIVILKLRVDARRCCGLGQTASTIGTRAMCLADPIS